MYRTTTPTHTFTLPIDTSECAVIKVTYLQDAVRLVKLKQGADISPGMTLDEDCVVINLTQEETKAFKPGQVQVQLRALTNGATLATATWNVKLSSSGTATSRSNTTARGIYPYSCTLSTTDGVTSAAIVMYSCYNSTQTGTINGTYTARVYGVKLYDLIGG